MKAAEWLYSGDTGEDDLAVSVLDVRGADYEAGREAEQAIVAKWSARSQVVGWVWKG